MSTESPIPRRRLHEVTALAAAAFSPARDRSQTCDSDREISWSASPSRSVTPSSPKVPNVRWTPEMKQALLATLVQKAVEDGLRADSGYKKDAWDAAFEAVWRVSTDKSITMKYCKTKHDTCFEELH
ncbi:hypothetical protein K469DRAFT_754344 [Zopfia rhizophila CBS 207.26]|uniref:Myb/SANT-like domain-containing protein n=1 Tax=Zopfia rhizophila CBS 207.26 TaxID=1314779 RepID=A0A6A6DJV2_9PEZI|nr:hypothetical protein K469DRAFT_754344 [Zopfia rhizophila CBS 207.26]